MINIIKFEGGLGNQLFQYAFYLAVKKRYRNDLFLFDIRESVHCHNGFELFDIFNLHGRYKYRVYNILKYRLKFKFSFFHNICEDVPRTYDSKLLVSHGKYNIFSGYWQCERWFAGLEKEVRESFQFRETLLSDKTFALARKIKNGQSPFCSVHIRRGDYLKIERFGVLSVDYYNNAINIIKTKCGSDVVFCVFSDDLCWCKEHLKIDAIFVDWNTGADSWQDMYLMSLCHHNIIANSTFSWWGAWLNKNRDKLVIAPKQWFVYSPNYDIFPSGWLNV